MSEAEKEKETTPAPSVAETLAAFKEQYEKEIDALKKQIEEENKQHAKEIADILIGAEKRKKEEEDEAKKRADTLKNSVNRVRARLGLETEK